MEKSQRLVYLDLIRVIAMIMMILGHSFFDLVRANLININVFPWVVWEFLRGLTAPIFLFVSGIVQVFANKRVEGKLPKAKVHKRIRTALLLIFLAYFLNFPVQRAFHIFFQTTDALINFFQVNILQLTGITLLWLLLYFVLTKDNRQLGFISLVTGIIIFALTPFVHLVDWFEILPLPIAPYFSLVKGSYFTIFPFSGFLFWGVAFGTYLERYPLEYRAKIMLRKGFYLGILLLPLGFVIYSLINLLNLPFFDVFKANPGMSIIRLACIGLGLSLIVLIYQKYLVKYQIINKVSFILGKNALFVYVVHLIVLYGFPWYPSLASIYHKNFGILESFVLSSLVVVVSFALVFIFENLFSERRLLKSIFKFGTVISMILMIFV